jgi:hypothetical protein
MKFPGDAFFLFGAGDRRKMLYKAGTLYDALTGDVIRRWDRLSGRIEPSEYRVSIQLRNGAMVRIVEDEHRVYVEHNARRETLTTGAVRLPRFEGHPYAPLLRRLHHEILVNIVQGKPVPNLLVYRKPWYRDAAMMLMCLAQTDNLDLVRTWVLGLREPFDRNNAGQAEPDNLGQALYMISLVSGSSHPLVKTIIDVLPKFSQDRHLVGNSDFAPHPVYQTKWLKYGLRALQLKDDYSIPHVSDSYSSLFWMDYNRDHVAGSRLGADQNYPYLSWAESHFYQDEPPMPVDDTQYPLSWEAHASQADYEGMNIISPAFTALKLAVPHTWHAAEMFFYFRSRGARGTRLNA